MSADHDRRPEPGASTQLPGVAQERAVQERFRIRHERHLELLDRVSQAGKRVEPEWLRRRRRKCLRVRLSRHELDRFSIGAPDLGEVRSEGDSRLTTDRGRRMFGGVCVKAWGDAQDAIEGLARLPFTLVQERALESLTAEVCRDRRDRDHLVLDLRVPFVQEAHRAEDLSGDP